MLEAILFTGLDGIYKDAINTVRMEFKLEMAKQRNLLTVTFQTPFLAMLPQKVWNLLYSAWRRVNSINLSERISQETC